MKKKILSCMLLAAVTGITACNQTPTDNNKQNSAMNNSAEYIIENIMTRTSIRSFTDKSISKELLDSVVRAGMAAPSAMNKQPWEFVVVTEREMLDSLMAVHPYSNLKTATAAIIVCGEKERFIEGEGAGYWVQDCSAATENILLAAHAYGLGAVWCGVYPVTERVNAVRAVLEIPESAIPLNIISMGYPADTPAPKDKWNPNRIHYQRW